VKASEFLTRHGIDYSVTPIDKPATERDLSGHPWFRVLFVLPDPHGDRQTHADYGGAANDDVDTVSADIGYVFYRMADAARYGESYEELLSDFGTDLHLSREDWERGQKAVRERCRAWLLDDTVWEEFLSVEADDVDATPA
jgi:hypothetical protein